MHFTLLSAVLGAAWWLTMLEVAGVDGIVDNVVLVQLVITYLPYDFGNETAGSHVRGNAKTRPSEQ